MANCRVFIIFVAVTLFVSVLHAERARNDNLEDEEIDLVNYEADEVIENIKRFLRGKKNKTTTAKPSSGAISALITTTQKSSIFGGGGSGRKASVSTTTSRYTGIRSTTASAKNACGVISPCKNGGTCKTLSSGSYYCFCPQDYYGKTCENKFISTGAANKDRAVTDHCAKSPCRNGGECVGLRTTYYCRCKSPHYGINCDKSIGKREEIIDEPNSFEQDLIAYERDLEEDRDDLRQAINDNNDENYE